MLGPTHDRPLGVSRIVYFEILEGDRKKVEAQSNIDPSRGGGARDLRFPMQFKGIMTKLFPMSKVQSRTSGKTTRPHVVEIQTGELSRYDKDGIQHSATVEVWPPTEARPSEIRIARVHEIEAMRDMPLNPHGRLFLFLVQDTNQVVRVHYSDADTLASGEFNTAFVKMIEQCARVRGAERIMGFIDYEDGIQYCHE